MDADREYHVDRESVPGSEKDKKTGEEKKGGSRSSFNYNGIYFNLNTEVDRDVFVTALEFFGPVKEEKAKYEIFVKIHQKTSVMSDICGCFPSCWGPTYYEDVIMPPCKATVEAMKGKNIKFPLPKPILLERGEQYIIKFQLEGPDTEQMKAFNMFPEVKVDDGRVVQFYLGGTRQIPRVYFKMV